MVKMLSHRMMDNLSCMLLAKDELQAHLQAQAAAQGSIDAQEDSELAKENALLRMQLLEAAADNDAISTSLQERVRSLADMTDAKFKAESEAKVLQVQIKSVRKDMDAHKYELHLLRKQLQIRNDEREQNNKESNASHKQHLDNVKKIARLESECQRLRGLIRQRLPGPAIIAQMRAECEMNRKKRSQCRSTPPKSLPNSSYLYHQREREALVERLLTVEDEAKYLKEALAKRSAELQEARQLCARTAMKLSSVQELVDAKSIGSVPSMPQPPRTHLVTINDAPMKDTHANHGGVYASSIKHRDNMMSIDSEEESSCANNGESDELSRAESWASALFAELSNLSNFHENVSNEKLSISNSQHKNTIANGFQPNYAHIDALQELDPSSCLHKVSQKLSHVGESLLLSGLTSNEDQVNHADMKGNDAHIGSASFWPQQSDNIELEVDQTFNILDEISHIKHMLLELGRVMEIQGKLDDSSVNVINDDEEAIHDEISAIHDEITANQEGKISGISIGERNLSRSHSMEDVQFSARFCDATKISTAAIANMEEVGDKIFNCCAEGAKFSGETAKFSGTDKNSEDIDDKNSAKFSGTEDIGDRMIKSLANFSVTAKFSDVTLEQIASGVSKSSNVGTNFSENIANMEEVVINPNGVATFISSLQLNLAADICDVASYLPLQPVETTLENADVDVHVDLQTLLQAAQAELELSNGKIATLEVELSRVLDEKADVTQQLSDTCSLKKNLEAELACSLANVEELTLQVSSLKSQLALADQDQDRTSIPLLNGKPVTQLGMLLDMKEEQDLAAARAQLADCQRNIHVMRKQMTSNILNSLSQDVIIDELSFFDSSSQSSKSTGLNSHLTSPNMSKAANFDVQQEDNSSCHNISCNVSALQEDPSNHNIEKVQSFERCRVDHVVEDSKSCDLLIRSTSKIHEVKPQAKPTKLSTTARIVEFFHKAKSTRPSVL